MKKTIILSMLLGLFLLTPLYVSSDKESGMSIPGSIEEIKLLGKSAIKAFPNALKEAGQETLTIMKNIWGYIEGFVIKYIEPVIFRTINWLKDLFGKEVEQRKPEIKKELQREAKEVKEKLPTGRGLWERFKSLFR